MAFYLPLHSVMKISNSAQSANRHCMDVNPRLLNASDFSRPPVLRVRQQRLYTRWGPLPLYPCEEPHQGHTAPISDQPPSHSSCWQVVRTSKGLFVACPVCKTQVRSGLLLEHMEGHQQQTSEWNQSHPCQLCMDQGDFCTRVAPEHLWFHVLYRHKVNGHLPGLALDPELGEWASWIKRV